MTKLFTNRQNNKYTYSYNLSSLKQWGTLLGFLFIFLLIIVGLSIYRFNYWSNLESNIQEGSYDYTEYNQTKAANIINDYDAKSLHLQNLLNELSALPTASTSEESSTTTDVVNSDTPDENVPENNPPATL